MPNVRQSESEFSFRFSLLRMLSEDRREDTSHDICGCAYAEHYITKCDHISFLLSFLSEMLFLLSVITVYHTASYKLLTDLSRSKNFFILKKHDPFISSFRGSIPTGSITFRNSFYKLCRLCGTISHFCCLCNETAHIAY